MVQRGVLSVSSHDPHQEGRVSVDSNHTTLVFCFWWLSVALLCNVHTRAHLHMCSALASHTASKPVLLIERDAQGKAQDMYLCMQN